MSYSGTPTPALVQNLTQYVSYVSNPTATLTDYQNAAQCMSAAYEVLTTNTTDANLALLWNFFVTYQNTYASENYALVGIGVLPPDDRFNYELMYSLFRQATNGQIMPSAATMVGSVLQLPLIVNYLQQQAEIVESSLTNSFTPIIGFPIATTSSVGMVEVGAGLSITPEGVLSANVTGGGGSGDVVVGTTAGTVAAGDDPRIVGALSAASAALLYAPVTAIPAPSTTAPLQDGVATVGTSTQYSRQDHVHPSDITKLSVSNNLSDIQNPTAARNNLGLSVAATLNIGTTPGTLVAGNDPRITGALSTSAASITYALISSLPLPATATPSQDGVATTGTSTFYARQDHIHPSDTSRLAAANNLSDLNNVFTARTNLGLGTSATLNVGQTTYTIAAGDDSRIVNAYPSSNPQGFQTAAQVNAALASIIGAAPAMLSTLAAIVTKIQADEANEGALSTLVSTQASQISANTTAINTKLSTTVAATTYATIVSLNALSSSLSAIALSGSASDLATGLVSLARGGTGVSSIAAFKTAYGFGTSSGLNVGTTTGTVAAGDDPRITGALSVALAMQTYTPIASTPQPATILPSQNGTASIGTSTLYARQDHVHPADNTRLLASNNLSDVLNPALARSNLGLGSAALSNTSAFDVAGAAAAAQATAIASAASSGLQKSSNLSDLPNVATARSNLGLGTAATSNSSAFDVAGSALSAQIAAIAAANTAAVNNYATITSVNALSALLSIMTVSGIQVNTGPNYAMLTTDRIVIVNKSTGSPTAITLPSSPVNWVSYIIKDGLGDASMNNITITGSTNIDNKASLVISQPYGSVTLVFNGTSWSII